MNCMIQTGTGSPSRGDSGRGVTGTGRYSAVRVTPSRRPSSVVFQGIHTNAPAGAFCLVTHLKSNWNHILEEINRWYELLRGKLAINYIPVGSSSLA